MNWQSFAFASAIFASLTAVFGKIGVSELNSNLATFIRTVVILVVSTLMISMRQEWIRPTSLPLKSVLALIASGIATGLSWLCYYRALQLGPASRVAPLDKLSVVFVIIFSVIFLGETLSLKTALGGLFIVAGAVLMAI